MQPIIVAVETDANGYDVDVCNGFWHPKEVDVHTKMARLQQEVDEGIYAYKWSGANKRKFVAKALQREHSINLRLFSETFKQIRKDEIG